MNDHHLTSSSSNFCPDGDAEPACTEATDNDPVLPLFLDLLERDIAANPERLQTVDARLLARINSLVGDIEIDINSPLSADDE
ncbi:type II toxin-antitoxin system PrlF family antitoxin [Pseudomonas gregormendelii]|uniref:Type II toxin-antitoxin system PrlF family antitoxin n=1 Tax=Pseudomonas gregormendelii TaxID=1628277 RepID=A0ABS3AM79_9PSED|nr:type II toxin-antitoxin system PrlF family antitoxin [Pseudomonas gregormendelii]MBN3968292.1 type II toxin-antitoxin system PrlF family antitoxin [Pseudomonas gregormendelii]